MPVLRWTRCRPNRSWRSILASVVVLAVLCCSSSLMKVCADDGHGPGSTHALQDASIHVELEDKYVKIRASPNLVGGELGISETGAHEAGWRGEDCHSSGAVCHTLTSPTTTLSQVHRTGDVVPGTTLFDHHFGSSLTYFVRTAAGCVVGGHDPMVYAEYGCALAVVDELVASRPAGHVEPTLWRELQTSGGDDRGGVPGQNRDAIDGTPAPAPEPATLAEEPHRERVRALHTAAAKHCCKHCARGKPCGNTCIAATSSCHSIGGCACW